MKVAYNACFGGFGLSYAAIMRYAELKGIKLYAFTDKRRPDGGLVPLKEKNRMRPITADEAPTTFMIHYCTTPEYSDESYWSGYDMRNNRSDPALIQVIEELGDKANGECAKLRIEDVPKGTLWRIDEYDGNETVATRDSYEWQIAS